MNMSQALSDINDAEEIRKASLLLQEKGYIANSTAESIRRTVAKRVGESQAYLDVVPKVEAMVNILLQSSPVRISTLRHGFFKEWCEMNEYEQSALVDAYLEAHSD